MDQKLKFLKFQQSPLLASAPELLAVPAPAPELCTIPGPSYQSLLQLLDDLLLLLLLLLLLQDGVGLGEGLW